MKKLLIILAVFVGCTNSQKEVADKPTDKPAKVMLVESELPEMSLFHLPATWKTQNNETIKLNDLQGNVLVMVMIYTTCKIACPRLVADMRSIEEKVSKQVSQDVKYVLVSIDPETDTPERLKAFAKENHMDGDQWIFLQGTKETTREFASVLAVKYKQISPIDFSHSNIISVFNQQGELVNQQEGLGVDNSETVETILRLAK